MRGVLHQGAEERRQQALQVLARGPRDLAGEEGHGVFEQVEDAAQLVQVGHGLGRRVLDGHLLAEGEDRQLRRPHPRHADQLDHVLQQALVLPRPLGGDQDAGQAMVGGGDDAPSVELAVERMLKPSSSSSRAMPRTRSPATVSALMSRWTMRMGNFRSLYIVSPEC